MASAMGDRNDLSDTCMCCADICMSGVIIMPDDRKPGDIMAGDMPILMALILSPLRDMTGDDILAMKG